MKRTTSAKKKVGGARPTKVGALSGKATSPIGQRESEQLATIRRGARAAVEALGPVRAPRATDDYELWREKEVTRRVDAAAAIEAKVRQDDGLLTRALRQIVVDLDSHRVHLRENAHALSPTDLLEIDCPPRFASARTMEQRAKAAALVASAIQNIEDAVDVILCGGTFSFNARGKRS